MDSGLEQCRDASLDRVKKAESSLNPIRAAEEPFGVGDIVWLVDRHGPRDGRKAKHTLRHTGPYQVTQLNAHFCYWVQHVHTGARYRVHFDHITLAPEATQLKYRSLLKRGEGERSESPRLMAPLHPHLGQHPSVIVSNGSEPSSSTSEHSATPSTPITPTMAVEPHVSTTTRPVSVVNPFGATFKDTLRHSSSTLHNNQTEPTTTQTTRSGRAVVVPTRYLNMFLTFQAPGYLVPVASSSDAEEREGGRM